MVTRPQTYTHIARNPAILEGEPVIKGTRISVRTVVLMERLYRDIGRVQEALPHLARADIVQALDFYKEHRAEIDEYIAQNDVDEELLIDERLGWLRPPSISTNVSILASCRAYAYGASASR